MQYRKNKPAGNTLQFALALLLLCLSGCAVVKPWTDPLRGQELQTAAGTIERILGKRNSCGQTIEGDLSLFIKYSLSQNAASGYFQFTRPSDFRFTVSNSFGQPILITAGNQVSFQLLNTVSRAYLAGNLTSICIRNNIPVQVVKGNWEEWITGTKKLPAQPLEIRNDVKSNGLWVTYKNSSGGLEHLYIDLDGEKITQRLLEDTDKKRWGEIQYLSWTSQGSCALPSEIVIKGLTNNVEIRFVFTDISTTDEPRNYKLTVPPGFSKKYYP